MSGMARKSLSQGLRSSCRSQSWVPFLGYPSSNQSASRGATRRSAREAATPSRIVGPRPTGQHLGEEEEEEEG